MEWIASQSGPLEWYYPCHSVKDPLAMIDKVEPGIASQHTLPQPLATRVRQSEHQHIRLSQA